MEKPTRPDLRVDTQQRMNPMRDMRVCRSGWILGRFWRVRGKTELRQRVGFDEIAKVVERVSGEPWCEYRDRHGDRRRDLVLWVARKSMGLTLGELGDGSGGMDYAAVTMAIRRFPEACERDKALGRLVKQVLRECEKLYVKM